MKKTFQSLKYLIFFDFKKLIAFELFIRLFGLFILYPLIQLGLFISIRMSGLKYISNLNLVEYLTKPTTILIFLLIVIIFSLYILVEYVFLAIFFDFAHQKRKLNYKQFVFLGFQKVINLLKKYHILIIFSVLLFFILIEFGKIAIFSSTIKLPSSLTDQVDFLNYLSIYSLIIFGFLIIFFLEFMFVIHDFIVKGSNIKESFSNSRTILKSNRAKILVRFILINLLINLLMILIYTGLIFTIGLFISLLRGQTIVFGLIITSMYSIYWILALIFTIIILPINVAFISNQYFKNKKTEIIEIDSNEPEPKPFHWIIKPFIIVFIVFFSLNVITIIQSVRNANNDIQFLKQEEIIAHRGASYIAPENTLSAINLAIDQGIQAVEFDVKGTKDHIPILMHDNTIKRTTNATTDLKVENLNYEELLQYDAGSWFSPEYSGEIIPTLEDVLITIKGKATAFIDMKTTDPLVEAEIIRLLAENDMIDEVKIMSFDINQLYRFKGYNNNIETILLIAAYYGNISTLLEDDFINHFALRINVIQTNPKLIQLIHNQNKNAYAWVVDDKDAIYTAMNADVDGFITKRPIATREIAYSKNSTEDFKRLLETLFKP